MYAAKRRNHAIFEGQPDLLPGHGGRLPAPRAAARLCLGIGKHKAAYKQLLDNTNLELCACNDRGEWLRIQGTANFDNTPEAQEAAFLQMPQLSDIYNEESGLKLGIVYLDHLSAKLFSMSGTVKDIMNY